MQTQTSIKDIPDFLIQLFNTAVDAAHPKNTLAQYLPADRTGKAIVIGAGKGAASMAQAFEQAWSGPIQGTVVTRYEHGAPCQHIEVIEASHPVPDSAGEEAAQKILTLTEGLTKDDNVFFLLSGGGSSLLSLPAPGITLEEKKLVNKALLKSGAAIDEINCVRKHLSAIKGGRLALACNEAKLYTYAISDVPGDDPSVIASGPSVADNTTREQAIEILERYKIDAPATVINWLNSSESETPSTKELPPETTHYQLIATPNQSILAAAAYAKSQGIEPLILGDTIEGEAREVAKVMGGIAQYIAQNNSPTRKPCVILSGGETTVTVTGNGRGGRNAEFLLSLTDYMQEKCEIYALAADTDGIDGSEDNAGAIITPDSISKAKSLNLSSSKYLQNNDGYTFFETLDTLIVTGPTRTNVNDFRAIVVL